MDPNPFVAPIVASLAEPQDEFDRISVSFSGEGSLPSAFATTDLAAASIAAAGSQIASLVGSPTLTVDRVASSLWFAFSIRPIGWELPPVWDAIAGDYQCVDGFIRLHTNAPHHRDAAMRVLGGHATRESVEARVTEWRMDDLEDAVVAEGGVAAAMRDYATWKTHPHGKMVNAEELVARSLADEALDLNWKPDPSRPLQGLKVLDLTRILAGPVATRFLACFGADVLRIDPPDWSEPLVAPEVTLGKRCARLDLRSSEGRDHLLALLAEAQVLVHGYRADALERLGLGESERRKVNPGLVDIALNAYGWTGPWRTRRGFDSLVQMSSGIAAEGMRVAAATKPTPLPVQALDHATGYLLAAAAVRGVRDRIATRRGSSARISLARVAKLLQDGPSGHFDDSLVGADLVEVTREDTPYGPLDRLVPPLSIEGVPARWDRAATTLGSSPASW